MVFFFSIKKNAQDCFIMSFKSVGHPVPPPPSRCQYLNKIKWIIDQERGEGKWLSFSLVSIHLSTWHMHLHIYTQYIYIYTYIVPWLHCLHMYYVPSPYSHTTVNFPIFSLQPQENTISKISKINTTTTPPLSTLFRYSICPDEAESFHYVITTLHVFKKETTLDFVGTRKRKYYYYLLAHGTLLARMGK